jgi:AcrR family transcriptional regulator
LLEAAVVVFSEKGYARATTKEIAANAGVAEGTIYRHFSDKLELFRAAFAEQTTAVAGELLDLPGLVGKGTIRGNVKRFIDVIEEVEAAIAPMQASMWSDAELREALAASAEPLGAGPGAAGSPIGPIAGYLEAEQEIGRIRADVDTERAAFALFSIPFTAVMISRMGGGAARPSELDLMEAVDVLLAGILPADAG